MQTTWRSVCTIFTRSRCARITASTSLYADGASSRTPASLRHSTPLGLAHEIRERQAPACLAAAEPASRAVRARQEGSRIAQTAHDERPRAHRAGDETELAQAGANGTLARHEHVGTVVPFACNVVVVAVHDGRAAREVREPDIAVRQRIERTLEHQLAVETRILLRPAHRLDVRVEGRCVLAQVGEIAIGQGHTAILQLTLRDLDVGGADPVPRSTRARVQDEPDIAVLVQAQLAEVVAATHRAELLARGALRLEFGSRRPAGHRIVAARPQSLRTRTGPAAAGPRFLSLRT